MRVLLDAILRRLVSAGRLTVIWPNGSRKTNGTDGDPHAAMRLRDWRTVRRLILNPALATGEAYMNGDLVAEDGSIYDVMDVVMASLGSNPNGHPLLRLQEILSAVGRRL